MANVQKQNAGLDLGTAGLVIGIIALLVSFIPGLGALGIIPGIIAIILSLVALIQAIKGGGAKKLVVTALIISILGTVIAGIWSARLMSVNKSGDTKTENNEFISGAKEGESDADTSEKNTENMKKLENQLEQLEKNPDSLKK